MNGQQILSHWIIEQNKNKNKYKQAFNFIIAHGTADKICSIFYSLTNLDFLAFQLWSLWMNVIDFDWIVCCQVGMRLLNMKQSVGKFEAGKSSNLSRQDYTDNLERQLSELRQKVTLNNSTMVDCTNNPEKFLQVLNQINEEGIKRIQVQQFEESLVYFEEAERILEYAASCGKTIDRNIIICILHNESCSFQRIYDLPKLANYLEALIYNLEISIKNTESKEDLFSCSEQLYQKGSYQEDTLTNLIKRKVAYSRYHLLYCALNSKNFQHETAIKVAQKSINILQEVCEICHNYQHKKNDLFPAVNTSGSYVPNNSLLELAKLENDLMPQSYEKYLKKVKKLLATKFSDDKMQRNTSIQESINSFSIGKIMQIAPMTLEEAQEKIDMEEECSDLGKIKKALHISAGFFSIGTELRLLSSKSQSKSQNYKSSDEFTLSQVYHLYSILIVLQYVPCQTVFLTHLLTSFNNHYSVELELKAKMKEKMEESRLSYDEADKREQVLEILPEHSEIQMQGESRWSKSQLRSPSSENLSEKKFVSKSSRQGISKKKKNKIGAEYKVMARREEQVNPAVTPLTDRLEKQGRKLKTQATTSIKKTSIHSTSKKKEGKNLESIKFGRNFDKKNRESQKKERKSKSKQRVGSFKNLVISDLFSPIKSKDFKGMVINKNKSKERKKSKENVVSKEKKNYSKEKDRKLINTIRVNLNSQIHGEKNMFSPTHHQFRQLEKTVRKSKPKKSLDTKRKLKKTIK